MKFAATFMSFLFALPTALGAAVSGPVPFTTTLATYTTSPATHTHTYTGTDTYTGSDTNTAYTALQTRAVGELANVEKRQIAEIIIALASVVRHILEQIGRDDRARGEFTQRVVSEGIAQWPQYNWVICHTRHSTFFDGNQGEQWGHYHEEFDIAIGGTIGYEIYWFESGRFERHGDGGFLNWAWVGQAVSVENNGATVTFV